MCRDAAADPDFALQAGLEHRYIPKAKAEAAARGYYHGQINGVIAGLNRGGSAVIKHYALRLILWRKSYTPFKFIKFLDYCDKLILLRKVGGGYIFIHRMLLEYFAELTPESVKAGDTTMGSKGARL